MDIIFCYKVWSVCIWCPESDSQKTCTLIQSFCKNCQELGLKPFTSKLLDLIISNLTVTLSRSVQRGGKLTSHLKIGEIQDCDSFSSVQELLSHSDT